MYDLLQLAEPLEPSTEVMAKDAVLLRHAALPFEERLLVALNEITAISPFRRMMTPGGYTMSVAMTNCGAAGWLTDRTGYRYDPKDPETGKPWAPMPACFLDLAVAAATEAGYPEFRPDACLINRYDPGDAFRCTKTRTNVISPIPLYQHRLACRRPFSSAA